MLFVRSILFLSLLNGRQNNVDYGTHFHKPMDLTLEIGGNFGELRPNHFHTGIDIKTEGKEGLPIYSIAAGYVSRIKVGTRGYGKVVYVDHPHLGITSVYAHCQNFVGLIAEYSLAKHREIEFFEFDINLPKNAITVKKGEQIAISGNTGTSTGPHLHFEIRETQTEHPLNPLLFESFHVPDSIPPTIHTLVLYSLSKYGYRIPEKRVEFPVKTKNGVYFLEKDTIDLPAHFCSEHGGIGVGIGVLDKNDNSEHACGIYEGVLSVNGDFVRRQIMNRLDFETNRQINTHKDYEAYKLSKSKIEKYYNTLHNQLPIYDLKLGNGILNLLPAHSYALQFYASDIAKNSSFLALVIRVLTGEMRTENTPYDHYHKDYLYPDSSYVFQSDAYEIHMPLNTLYEPVKKYLKAHAGQLTFGQAKEPLNFEILYKIRLEPEEPISREKMVLHHHESGSYFTGAIANDWFVASVKSFGTFSLKYDTIAPELRPKFKELDKPKAITRLAWKVKDDKSGLKHYALYVDNVYHVLEYEHKNSELFANLNLHSGKHEVVIIVKDAVENLRKVNYQLIAL